MCSEVKAILCQVWDSMFLKSIKYISRERKETRVEKKNSSRER